MYSAMWKSVGRKLELSAQVLDGSVRGTMYPNVKFGLNGRKLLLVVKEVGFSYCNWNICIYISSKRLMLFKSIKVAKELTLSLIN